MIKIVYEEDGAQFPNLMDSMYRHRAAQFRDRLNWEVHVDEDGWERDEYDKLNPLYLVFEQGDGTHGGSMRFLPTTSDTMINDHFTDLTGGVIIRSPFIWECTRFCLAPNADRSVSRAIMLATMELGLRADLKFFVGVFDRRMCRIYERIGWSPVIIGKGLSSDQELCAGLWPVSQVARDAILTRYAASTDNPNGSLARASLDEDFIAA